MSADEPPEIDPVKRSGLTMIILAWVCILAAATYYFSASEMDAINPNRHADAAFVDGKQSLELEANRDNHYFAPGKINGSKASFLLDTGATTVSIPASLQQKYGLEKEDEGLAYTANGPVIVHTTTIDELEIAGIVLTDVEATLNPGMNDSDLILLGMSALSRFNITIADGKLTIRP